MGLGEKETKVRALSFVFGEPFLPEDKKLKGESIGGQDNRIRNQKRFIQQQP